jgi:putative zinc finger protein
VNCLDAETLAAWFDGGLNGAALEDVRSHVAGCARCQALVGAMGRTRAASPAPQPERAPRWWLAWAVPAAAAATVLAIWVAVPRPTSVSVNSAPAAPVAKGEAQPQSVPPPASPVRTEPAAPPTPLAKRNLQARARPSEAAPPAAAPQSGDAAQQKADNIATLSAPAAPTAERREAAQPRAAIAGQLQARDAFAPNLCGAMWPALPSDLAGQITAAAAPSADVCWLVGRAGTVLRSTDHETWQRVSVPQSGDLSSITATDARTATVTAADGRTFSTSDGGVTWTQP